MKRHGHLFSQIASFENLYLASRKARRGKRFQDNVMRFEARVEEELLALQEELLSKSYVPGQYREFTVYERKPRKISAAPYRDRIVHHALCNVIEPLFERSFIYDSYACRKGKGTHRAVERFTRFCRANRYCLQADIEKYFPSIDHQILLEKIAKKIKCPDTLWLVRTIIAGSNRQEEANDYFPGDDLFTPFQRRRGIPIGNLTSQFFANCYLDDLDHYIKEELRCRFYLRYVDDLTVFANDKRWLREVRERIEQFLAGERLKLHPKKTFIAPARIGLDYLGYRIFPTHRKLRRDTSMRFGRSLKGMVRLWRQGLLPGERLNATLQSWWGHARYADVWGLMRSLAQRMEREGYDLGRRGMFGFGRSGTSVPLSAGREDGG